MQGSDISLTRTSDILLDVKDEVGQLRQYQESTRGQEIIDWLAPVNFTGQQSNTFHRRQKGTGAWFLATEEFTKWSDIRNSILFCPGIPGAGKTFLTSIVVDHLEHTFGPDPKVGIAYLYCNFRQQHEQKIEHLLESILKQFIQRQPCVNDDIKAIYNRHRPMGGRPSLDELCTALNSVLKTLARSFIVVDALDECSVTADLLSSIFGLQSKYSVSFLATSRYIPEITTLF